MTPKAKTESVRHHLVAEIDLTAIARNVQTLRSRMEPGCQMCVAIKADAYGHGADLVLPVLAREGVEMVGVATIGEASEAREWGWQGSILLMGSELNGYVGPRQRDRAEWLVANEISSTVSSLGDVDALDLAAQAVGKPAIVHFMLDTGMTREGVYEEAVREMIERARSSDSIRRPLHALCHRGRSRQVFCPRAVRTLWAFRRRTGVAGSRDPPSPRRELSRND